MALHPLSQRFGDVAAAYERGRPTTPPAVVGAIGAELGIAPGAPVLDLGAGTGKLTRTLVELGFEVSAVEPQAELREILAQKVGAERVHEGTAEAIPLPDDSLAAVFVADAFHWFDHAVALAEIARVLRPGGGLAVITTAPDWSGASWAHEVGMLMEQVRPEHPLVDSPPWQQSAAAAGCWSQPREIHMRTTVPALSARLADYLCSVSWIASLHERERQGLLDRAGEIVAAGHTPAEMGLHANVVVVSLL